MIASLRRVEIRFAKKFVDLKYDPGGKPSLPENPRQSLSKRVQGFRKSGIQQPAARNSEPQH